jgi:hypothetical protein
MKQVKVNPIVTTQVDRLKVNRLKEKICAIIQNQNRLEPLTGDWIMDGDSLGRQDSGVRIHNGTRIGCRQFAGLFKQLAQLIDVAAVPILTPEFCLLTT